MCNIPCSLLPVSLLPVNTDHFSVEFKFKLTVPIYPIIYLKKMPYLLKAAFMTWKTCSYI